MRPQRVPLLVSLVVLLAAAACTADPDGAAPAPPTTAPGATPSGAATTPAAPSTAPVPAPTGPATTRPATDWHVTYAWAVPRGPVRVTHTVRVPVTPPPGSPLPTLVEVRVGDHPAEGFSRITFAFRGATPSYRVAYVPQVEADGSGQPVALPGNAFLRVQFDPAQAHDEAGRSTVRAAPAPFIGYPTLRGWAAAGDFEGYVSFGLGLQVAAGSDQVLPIRLSELTRPDGSHVVAVDVRRS